ncbi:unnamed protein product [Ambrosiozyma monospora]|uniref:Unnamed protein product n=1 Tax=Ambrosiozyma monospora TaxID=43982 RepID=A0ACB5T650_AMBMO|nr:unnamed protein product [Ambrosiozyma monospora]
MISTSRPAHLLCLESDVWHHHNQNPTFHTTSPQTSIMGNIPSNLLDDLSEVGSDEIDRLAKRFMKLDADNSGAIEKNEFLAIPGIGQNPLAKRVIDIFDENKGGDIDFKEFVAGLSVFSSAGSVDDKLRFLFKVYDIDNDGYISNGELFLVLRMMVANSLTDIQLQQLVDRTIMESDHDGDGKLSFDEFKQTINAKLALVHKRFVSLLCHPKDTISCVDDSMSLPAETTDKTDKNKPGIKFESSFARARSLRRLSSGMSIHLVTTYTTVSKRHLTNRLELNYELIVSIADHETQLTSLLNNISQPDLLEEAGETFANHSLTELPSPTPSISTKKHNDNENTKHQSKSPLNGSESTSDENVSTPAGSDGPIPSISQDHAQKLAGKGLDNVSLASVWPDFSFSSHLQDVPHMYNDSVSPLERGQDMRLMGQSKISMSPTNMTMSLPVLPSLGTIDDPLHFLKNQEILILNSLQKLIKNHHTYLAKGDKRLMKNRRRILDSFYQLYQIHQSMKELYNSDKYSKLNLLKEFQARANRKAKIQKKIHDEQNNTDEGKTYQFLYNESVSIGSEIVKLEARCQAQWL